MRSDWQADAAAMIAETHASLPADATLAERKAALRKRAGEFSLGTSWGAKVWSRKVRAYLEQHGLPPLDPMRAGTKSAQHIKVRRSRRGWRRDLPVSERAMKCGRCEGTGKTVWLGFHPNGKPIMIGPCPQCAGRPATVMAERHRLSVWPHSPILCPENRSPR